MRQYIFSRMFPILIFSFSLYQCSLVNSPSMPATPTHFTHPSTKPSQKIISTSTSIPSVNPTLTATPAADEHWTVYYPNMVYDLVFDLDGNLWSTSAGMGVLKWDIKTKIFTQYSTNEGLPSPWTYDLAVSSNGDVWVATGEGLAQYNGTTWIQHTRETDLNFTKTNSVAIGADGKIWAGTMDGNFASYDGHIWTDYSSLSKEKSIQRIDHIVVGPDGTVWLLSSDRFFRFDERVITDANFPFRVVTGLAFDNLGHMWLGTENGPAFYDGSSWNLMDTFPIPGSGNDVSAVAVDSKDGLWVGFKYQGVGFLKGQESRWFTKYSTLSPQGGLTSDNIISIAIGPDDTPWFGTAYNGIAHYNGYQWESYTTNSFVGLGISDALISRDGSLWIASFSEGLSRFNSERWETFFDKTDWEFSHVQAIAQQDNGTIWFGSTGGKIFRMADDQWQAFSNSIYQFNINDISIAKNNLIWLGTDEGVIGFNGAQWINYRHEPYPSEKYELNKKYNMIFKILADKDGGFWFTSNLGVLHRNSGNRWLEYTGSQGIGISPVAVLEAETDGTVWAGAEDGAYRFDGKVFTRYYSEDSNSRSITSIAFAVDGTVWVGTENGEVFIWDGQSFNHFPIKDGWEKTSPEAENPVSKILFGPDGSIWFVRGYLLSRYRETP
jgi:ligand-binding sensor domain-containing protein